MDSFELNKIMGAVLGTVFVVFSVSLVSDAIFSSPAPETPGFEIAAAEGGAADAGDAGDAAESVLPLLASADPEAGASVFRRCQACHTVEDGGANKVGPNLYDIVNRPIAAHEGFGYSAAMQTFSEGGSVEWDYDHLDHFLNNPKGLVAGTAMAFAGLRKIEDRANVIAYLRTLSASPAPLPEPAAEEEPAPADDAAPTDDSAPAEDAPAGEEAPAEETAPAEQEAPAEAAPTEENPADAEEAPAEQTEPDTTPDQESAPAAEPDADADADTNGAPTPVLPQPAQ